ncbi:MAG: hypothetical protein SWY16_03825 [Cyanobacteriota bacterium]|nr:hypothetical protein [Cyanobacteriota bacterium]
MSPTNTLEDSKNTKNRTAKSTKSSANGQTDEAPAAENSTKEPASALAVADNSKATKSLSVRMRPASDLPQNRPISVSQYHITETFAAVGGERPIFSSGLQVCGTIDSSGQRPIAASGLAISEVYTSMGNRPVASNEIDDPNALMGYLD